MGPFLCSGSHQAQRDCQPSALNCFVEAMSQCVPPIPIRPCVLKYLGKTHNLWLRSTLMLEQQAFEKGLSLHSKPKQSTEFYEQESITPPQQVKFQNMFPLSWNVQFFILGSFFLIQGKPEKQSMGFMVSFGKFIIWTYCLSFSFELNLNSLKKINFIFFLYRRYWTPLLNFTLCSKKKTCGPGCGRKDASFLRLPQPLPMSSMASLNR